MAAGLTAAAPATAATPPPAFEIFYGQNCAAGKTASRVYTGANAGEQWINDRFNSTKWGSAGNNQLVRMNAASVYVSYAYLTLNYNRNFAWWSGRTTGNCFNLPEYMRNENLNWTLTP